MLVYPLHRSSDRSLCGCIVDLMALSLPPLTPKPRTVLGTQGGKSRRKAVLARARQLRGGVGGERS